MLKARDWPPDQGDTPMGPDGECGECDTGAGGQGAHYQCQGAVKQQIYTQRLPLCVSLGFLFRYIW